MRKTRLQNSIYFARNIVKTYNFQTNLATNMQTLLKYFFQDCWQLHVIDHGSTVDPRRPICKFILSTGCILVFDPDEQDIEFIHQGSSLVLG